MKRILNTLSQKWPEYLLEILVITIGIYAAFSLDSWNEERKERERENILLIQLKQEYLSNLDQLDKKNAVRDVIIKSGLETLTYFDDPSIANIDTVLARIGDLGLTGTYDPIDNDLVASGNINIIKNQKLKALLTKWTTDVIQVQEVEEIYSQRFHYIDLPYMTRLGIGRDLVRAPWSKIKSVDFLLNSDDVEVRSYGKSRHLSDVNQILNDATLEGIVSQAIFINEFINLEAMTLRKQIIEILQIIDSEIK